MYLPSETISTVFYWPESDLDQSDFAVEMFKGDAVYNQPFTISNIGSGIYGFVFTPDATNNISYEIIITQPLGNSYLRERASFFVNDTNTQAEFARDMTFNNSTYDPVTKILTIFEDDGETIKHRFETDFRTYRELIVE